MFILAFLSRRANKQGLWVGIIASLVFTAWATFTSGKNKMFDLGDYNFPWAGVMIGVGAHVIVLVVGWTRQLLLPGRHARTPEMTLWGWLEKRKLLSQKAAVEPATPNA